MQVCTQASTFPLTTAGTMKQVIHFIHVNSIAYAHVCLHTYFIGNNQTKQGACDCFPGIPCHVTVLAARIDNQQLRATTKDRPIAELSQRFLTFVKTSRTSQCQSSGDR